ncbi:MAG: hypothetical protein NWQ46_10910, partial [Spirosomaceae bacterium]|nr:hypothetical protein [Spirosomataceae bacterium]
MTAAIIAFSLTIGFILLIRYLRKKNERTTAARLKERWGKKRTDYANFELVGLYEKFVDQGDSKISPETCNDLDFDEVFSAIDHTSSRVGQQYLYNHIRQGKADQKWLTEFEKVVQFLDGNIELRLKAVTILDKLNHRSDYYFPLLFQDAPIQRIKYIWAIQLLQTFTFTSFALLFIYPSFFFLFLLSVTLSIGVHYWNKWQVEKYQHILKRFKKFFDTAKEVTDIQKENGFFYDEAQEEHVWKLRKISKKLRLISFGGNQGSEAEQITGLFIELFNIITLAEVSAFNRFFEQLPSFKKDFFSLFASIGTIDIAVSVASWRSSLPTYTTPDFCENKKRLAVENAVHPLVKNCVANSLTLENQSMILTGSNMAGKTTFIRTVALNALFAQTLQTVLATKYVAPVFKISSAIRFQDDLTDGQSYYLREVEGIKKLLNEAENTTPTLFI